MTFVSTTPVKIHQFPVTTAIDIQENELFELVDCLDIHYFPTGDWLGSPYSIINLPPTSPATAGPLQISDKTP